MPFFLNLKGYIAVNLFTPIPYNMRVFIKKYLLFFISVLFFQTIFSQPVIQSFTPASGSIGSIVTITGSGFSSTASNNIVYFGAVKAAVNYATLTSINVTVPAGASYELITVTTNNLVAYSDEPFIITFPGAAPVFASGLFKTRKDFAIAYEDPDSGYSFEFCNVDLDGDGKPEMVSANTSANSISVLRNTSSVGKLSFDVNRDFVTGSAPFSIDHGDFDGDGKQDIAVINSQSKTVSIFKNISTPGVISLATKIDINLGEEGFTDISIGDVDVDGKTDFVICGHNAQNISVYKNIGALGNISFAPQLNIKTGYGYEKVAVRDLDKDGKPDITSTFWGYSDYKIVVLRNISTPENISFDNPNQFNTGNGPYDIAIGDLDGDGKPDIALADNQAYTFSVLRNTSATGSISFDENIGFYVGRFPHGVAIGDIDGDGKPDMAVSNNEHYGYTVSIYKNNSSIGLIDFAGKVDLTTKGEPMGVSIADMDGDGEPEIEAIGGDASVMSVFIRCASVEINKQPVDTIICTRGNASFKIGTTDTAGHQWQADKGSGWNDLIDDSIYTGVNSNELHVSGITNQMNGYQYRCSVGNKCGVTFSSPAKLIVSTALPPSLQINADNTSVCKGALVKFTALPTNGGADPSYQWKKNNVNAGSNSNTYADSNFVAGDIINCILTSNAPCVSTNNAKSNDIVMMVSNQAIPQIFIAASSNNICFGTSVTFKAATSAEGSAPSYQWTKNDINVGSDSSVYIDSTLNNGDVIKCTLTSDFNCGITKAVSKEIVMIINPLITASISVTASQNNICPGTTVHFSASTSNEGLNPVFNWIKNGFNVGNNSAGYSDNNIAEGDIISCTLTLNATAGCLTSSVVTSNAVTINLLKNLPGEVHLGEDKNICQGTNITLNAPSGYTSYLWQNNSTSSSFIATEPGSYNLKAIDACGRVSSDTVLIILNNPPSQFLPADTSICSYEPVVLKSAKNYLQYLWSNNATTPSINISTPGTYWLQVTDNNNCTGRDSIKVSPKNCITGVYIPSAFTPNGDGKNDSFKPLLFGLVKQYEFKIFNRFGQTVFHSKDVGKGWDGMLAGILQTSNVFVWVCIYQLDGQKIIKKTGTVLLLK